MIGILIWSRIPKYRQVQNTQQYQNTARENKATQLQIISALWIMLKYTANQNSTAIISKPTYSRKLINTPVHIFQTNL